MTDYVLIPHMGVGQLLFGASRVAARAAMPGNPRSFLKSPGSQHETDGWHDNAFQVFYAGHLPTVDYIELSAGGHIQLLYKGISLFDRPCDEVVSLISLDAPYNKEDPELGQSYTFQSLDLSLRRPVVPKSSSDQEGQRFATIGIGIEGYYCRGVV